MKSELRNLFLLLLPLAVQTQDCLARGGAGTGVGGGGTAIVLPDDSVVLADAYISELG